MADAAASFWFKASLPELRRILLFLLYRLRHMFLIKGESGEKRGWSITLLSPTSITMLSYYLDAGVYFKRLIAARSDLLSGVIVGVAAIPVVGVAEIPVTDGAP